MWLLNELSPSDLCYPGQHNFNDDSLLLRRHHGLCPGAVGRANAATGDRYSHPLGYISTRHHAGNANCIAYKHHWSYRHIGSCYGDPAADAGSVRVAGTDQHTIAQRHAGEQPHGNPNSNSYGDGDHHADADGYKHIHPKPDWRTNRDSDDSANGYRNAFANARANSYGGAEHANAHSYRRRRSAANGTRYAPVRLTMSQGSEACLECRTMPRNMQEEEKQKAGRKSREWISTRV